jgi:hypothetical protein
MSASARECKRKSIQRKKGSADPGVNRVKINIASAVKGG